MKPQTRSFYADAVRRTIEQIVEHLDGALDLEVLARTACLSPFHFHRVFRGMVGETPVELLRRLRFERAAWRLLHTNASVTEIAFGAGYETHEAFTRAFRAAYASPPSAFRELENARFHLAAACGVHYGDVAGASAFTPRHSDIPMDVEIKQKPALRVASVRHIGPYMQINQAFERLGHIARQEGLFQLKGARMLAIYHDDPESTPAEQLRSDAGIVVPESATIPTSLTEQRLPAGRYACTLHVGPYERLGDVWQRLLGEWLPASGKRIDGLSYELYLNMPGEVPPEQLRTEICVPVS
ncbi:MAG TPA: AraC family transcriptional regulator [Gemmatimonadaceae bacterium]|nr:AraC family transcriptional regulator [Gemmatimonadaceae bacterium]